MSGTAGGVDDGDLHTSTVLTTNVDEHH